MKKHKRLIVGIAALILTALVAVWVFYEPPYLTELKRTELVEEGTEAPIKAVAAALEAIKNNDKRRLYDMMAVRDNVEFQRYTDVFFSEPEFFPTEVIGCTRLVNSHRRDNISVLIHSRPRGKSYQFALLKGSGGEYKIYSISSSGRKP